MSNFKGSLSRGEVSKLTRVEQEVLNLLTEEFLTIKKIAIKRGTTPRAVQKIVKKLKQKGAINPAMQKVRKSQGANEPFGGSIRLHGQEFNIQLLSKGEKYKGVLSRANLVRVDDNTVKLYNNSLEVYSGQSFFSEDAHKATAKSFVYWNRFFARLEHDFGVLLVKPRSLNIKLVKAHYSQCNNALAKECVMNGDKIKVFGRDDGKCWFLIDNSFNLEEAETVHPKSSKHDMGVVVAPFFNDLKDNPVTLSDLMRLIEGIANSQVSTLNSLGVSARLQQNTQREIVTLVKLLKPGKLKKSDVEVGRPDYFG